MFKSVFKNISNTLYFENKKTRKFFGNYQKKNFCSPKHKTCVSCEHILVILIVFTHFFCLFKKNKTNIKNNKNKTFHPKFILKKYLKT